MFAVQIMFLFGCTPKKVEFIRHLHSFSTCKYEVKFLNLLLKKIRNEIKNLKNTNMQKKRQKKDEREKRAKERVRKNKTVINVKSIHPLS